MKTTSVTSAFDSTLHFNWTGPLPVLGSIDEPLHNVKRHHTGSKETLRTTFADGLTQWARVPTGVSALSPT